MEAAENNHLDAVKYLIKAGALVDPKVLAAHPAPPSAPCEEEQGRFPGTPSGIGGHGAPTGV